ASRRIGCQTVRTRGHGPRRLRGRRWCRRDRGSDACASRDSADDPDPTSTDMKTLLLFPMIAFLSGATAPRRGAASAENEVLRWNRIVTDALAAAGTDPITESREMAIVQIAVHDALNAIQPKYETYGGSAGSMPGASAEMAVAVASHDALIALLP